MVVNKDSVLSQDHKSKYPHGNLLQGGDIKHRILMGLCSKAVLKCCASDH